MRQRARLLVIVLGLWLGILHLSVKSATAATEVELQSAVFRGKPAVVMWNRGVDFYVRDLHFRAYRNLRAAAELHPGFPDVERVRHDCDLRAKAQPFLHREEVQWALLVLAFAGTLVGGWFGARWSVAAARRGIRRIVQEELRASRS